MPVILCDEWTPAQVKAFRLLVNRSATWADWDEELLAIELADLQKSEFDLPVGRFEIERFVEPQDAVVKRPCLLKIADPKADVRQSEQRQVLCEKPPQYQVKAKKHSHAMVHSGCTCVACALTECGSRVPGPWPRQTRQ